MEVRQIGSEDATTWDALIDDSPMENIFSYYSWLKITADKNKVQLEVLGIYDDNKLVGGCPLFIRREFGIVKVISNVYGLMPYSGIIVRNYSTKSVRAYEHYLHNIFNTLSKHLCKMKADFIFINNPPELIDVRPFTSDGWNIIVHYTYVLNPKDMVLSSGVKESIKKAKRQCLVVKKSDDLKQFFTLYEATYRDQGMKPNMSYDYLETMFNYLRNKNSVELWCTFTEEGKCVATQIVVWDKREVYNWVASVESESKEVGAGHLLYFEVLNYFMHNTGKPINLMMGNVPRLSNFITGFNPQLVPYYSIQKMSFIFKIIEKLWKIGVPKKT